MPETDPDGEDDRPAENIQLVVENTDNVQLVVENTVSEERPSVTNANLRPRAVIMADTAQNHMNPMDMIASPRISNPNPNIDLSNPNMNFNLASQTSEERDSLVAQERDSLVERNSLVADPNKVREKKSSLRSGKSSKPKQSVRFGDNAEKKTKPKPRTPWEMQTSASDITIKPTVVKRTKPREHKPTIHKSPKQAKTSMNPNTKIPQQRVAVVQGRRPKKRGSSRAGQGSKATLRLLSAVMNSKFEKAKKAIREGADVDGRRNSTRESLLHIAVDSEHVAICRLLIENGADRNAADREGRTPVHLAAYDGLDEILEMLLSHPGRKGRPESRNFEKQTPLQLAAKRGKLSTCKMLLEYCGDRALIEALDEDEETALTLAAWNDSADVVQLLLDHGASRDHANDWGCSALHQAIGKRHIEVVDVLLNPRLTIVETLVSAWGSLNIMRMLDWEFDEEVVLSIAIEIADFCEVHPELSLRNRQGMTCADICDENQYMEGLHSLLAFETGHGDKSKRVHDGMEKFFNAHPRKTIYMTEPPLPVGFEDLLLEDSSGSDSVLEEDDILMSPRAHARAAADAANFRRRAP